MQGIVKWFDCKKGYGFILHPEGEDDIFVHFSQIQTEKKFKELKPGQTVTFETTEREKGLQALNVVPLEEVAV